MPESNIYYWQDAATKIGGGGELGGLCGIAWRTLYHQGIYDTNSLATLNDTILLFSFMDHTIESSDCQKVGFMKCIRQLLC